MNKNIYLYFKKMSLSLRVRKELEPYFWNLKDEDIEILIRELGEKYIDDAIDFVKNLKISKETITKYAQAEQKSPEWFQYRDGRLTGSNFGAANKTNKRNTHNGLLKTLLWPSTFKGNMATRHGTVHEPIACDRYEEFQKNMLIENGCDPSDFWIEHTGFVVCEKYPWLGASPDMIVHYEKKTWVGEIKCPFPGRNGSSGKLYGDIPHYYYDQIQGLMAILELPVCDFVVWTEKEMSVERFVFDRPYFEERLFPNLQTFYVTKYLPRIIWKNNAMICHGDIDPILVI